MESSTGYRNKWVGWNERYLALLEEVECLLADDFAREGAVAILDIVVGTMVERRMIAEGGVGIG